VVMWVGGLGGWCGGVVVWWCGGVVVGVVGRFIKGERGGNRFGMSMWEREGGGGG